MLDGTLYQRGSNPRHLGLVSTPMD